MLIVFLSELPGCKVVQDAFNFLQSLWLSTLISLLESCTICLSVLEIPASSILN